MSPKVSVIIPNYNHGRYLEKRIQSVLHQTYQDFELLYLDDASTDNSHQVFGQFADHPRIRSILNDRNSGSTFKQWNRGIRAAQGEYIWLAESDDYADPTLLATLVDRLERHPNVGLAYCQSWRVDEQDHLLGLYQEWPEILDHQHWRQDFINSGPEECSRYLLFSNTIPNASAVVFRRSLYEQVGGASESMRICGDLLLWSSMLLRSDIAFVAQPLNYYRTHSNTVRSLTQKGSVGLEEILWVTYQIQKQVQIPPEVLPHYHHYYAITSESWLWAAMRGQIPLERNWRIYQLFSAINPALRSRIPQRLVTRSCQKALKVLGLPLPAANPS